MKFMKLSLFFALLAINITLHTMNQDIVRLRWNSANYKNNSQLQLSMGKNLLDYIKLEGSEKVLDLGCGTCELAAHMAQDLIPKGQVTAIDIDMNMLEAARQNYASLENLTIYQCSATELSLLDTDFDIVISVYCLHWIKDIDDMRIVMQGILERLKPGGKFIAIFNIKDTPAHPIVQMQLAQELVDSDKWGHYYKGHMPLGNNLSLEDYNALLKETGFRGKAVLQYPPLLSVSRDALKDSLLSMPITSHIPDESKEEFITDAIAKFIERGLRNENGTFRVGMTSCCINAIKPNE